MSRMQRTGGGDATTNDGMTATRRDARIPRTVGNIKDRGSLELERRISAVCERLREATSLNASRIDLIAIKGYPSPFLIYRPRGRIPSFVHPLYAIYREFVLREKKTTTLLAALPEPSYENFDRPLTSSHSSRALLING